MQQHSPQKICFFLRQIPLEQQTKSTRTIVCLNQSYVHKKRFGMLKQEQWLLIETIYDILSSIQQITSTWPWGKLICVLRVGLKFNALQRLHQKNLRHFWPCFQKDLMVACECWWRSYKQHTTKTEQKIFASQTSANNEKAWASFIVFLRFAAMVIQFSLARISFWNNQLLNQRCYDWHCVWHCVWHVSSHRVWHCVWHWIFAVFAIELATLLALFKVHPTAKHASFTSCTTCKMDAEFWSFWATCWQYLGILVRILSGQTKWSPLKDRELHSALHKSMPIRLAQFWPVGSAQRGTLNMAIHVATITSNTILFIQ